MRGYEWGTGTVRCGFCYVYGHNITSCSHVESIFKVLCNKLDGDPTYLPTPDERKAFVEIKRREEGQLLNYKKFLSQKTKDKLNDEQKYLLGIRDIDPTQIEDSVSVGATYTEEFGKSRGDIT